MAQAQDFDNLCLALSSSLISRLLSLGASLRTPFTSQISQVRQELPRPQVLLFLREKAHAQV